MRDRAARIVAIIAKAQQYQATGQVFLDANKDVSVPIDQATKDAWQAKVAQLQAAIKTIVAGW